MASSAFCMLVLGLPELAMGWLPLRFGIGSKRHCKPTDFLYNNVDILVVEDTINLQNFCIIMLTYHLFTHSHILPHTGEAE